MATRKDYVLITQALRDGMADYRTAEATKGILSTHVALHKLGYVHAAKTIGEALHKANPAFDLTRFYNELDIKE